MVPGAVAAKRPSATTSNEVCYAFPSRPRERQEGSGILASSSREYEEAYTLSEGENARQKARGWKVSGTRISKVSSWMFAR
jgi:hypothetical protein